MGIHSGLVGQLFVAAMQALKAGITEVNASGGINCHKLELITGDDGNDPARHQALIREFVEKRGVIAFVFNAAPFSGQSSVEYVTQKSVPVIGSKGGSRWFYQSPMFFPLGSSGDGLARASVQGMANYALPQGKKKTAVITCQEVEYCFLVDKAADDLAGKVGLDVVYKAKATLTQPDYTAECIQARNAGAETIITAFDGGSDHRLMASCAKVGFRPPIVASNAQAQENFKDDPNLQGSLIVMNALPWVVDHPAIAEYRRVIQKQTGKPVVESPSGMLAWQAVKGFELAARAGVQPGNATPTSAEILKGLYTLNGTDIAGLAPKQEIIRGKAPRLTSCGWNVIVGKGSYKSDGKMFCVQGETP